MIDIQTALYNLMHARYGQQVRQSLHDAVYQINENANEALQTAKAMGVGTAVTSASSSSTGYVAGNLYLNNSTWDLWQCIGTNSWLNCGNVKGAQGNRGTDGTSYYVYIRYSPNYDGTDFTASPTASSQYVGFYSGTSATAPTNKQDYAWTSYVGASGTSAYVHIMYSENADGSNFVSTPTANTKYIGFYSGTASSAPANKSLYTWSEYVGRSGTGTGDMLKSEFAGSGVVGAVDRALTADSATDSTNASNLKKSDNTTVSADDITAKLPNTVPTSANEGQAPVVQADGSVAWGDVASNSSNPNLIDNPFFEFRGSNSWNLSTKDVDNTLKKWSIDNGTGSVSNGILTNTAPIYQTVSDEIISYYLGKTVTISWIKADDTIDYETVTLPTTLTTSFTPYGTKDVVMMLRSGSNDSQIVRIKPSILSIGIKGVKLEIGDKSTISNDVRFYEGYTPYTITNELSSLGVVDIDIIQNAQVYTISANTSKTIIEENAPTDHAFYIYSIKFQTNTNSGITVDGNANVTSYSGSVGGVNTVYKWYNGTKLVSDGFTLYAKKGQGVSAGLWSTTTGQAAVTVQRIGIL